MVSFGNLSVSDLEKRLNISFNEIDSQFMKASHQTSAQSKDLEKDQWHCFDIPLMIHCGSLSMLVKIKRLLSEYAFNTKISLSHEFHESEKPENRIKLFEKNDNYSVPIPRFLFVKSHYVSEYETTYLFQLSKINKASLVYRRVNIQGYYSEFLGLEMNVIDQINEPQIHKENDFCYEKSSHLDIKLTNNHLIALDSLKSIFVNNKIITKWEGSLSFRESYCNSYNETEYLSAKKRTQDELKRIKNQNTICPF